MLEEFLWTSGGLKPQILRDPVGLPVSAARLTCCARHKSPDSARCGRIKGEQHRRQHRQMNLLAGALAWHLQSSERHSAQFYF